jgi:alpha-L-rhamnosidase
MWFVLELEEYLFRSGDRELVDNAKQRVYELVDYFKPFLNEDGLLEGLTRWVFVEWSAANSFVQDVNYPSNMLYAKMLEVAGRLYDDPALTEQATQVRKAIIKQSFDGEFFVDNAVRGKGGKLELTRNRTETCQYYAFYLGTATPESHPELWVKMLDKFGAVRSTNNEYPEIHPSNAFIGNYLRMELLSQAGRTKQILDENRSFYLPMVDKTGTLWENMTDHASCNHGFAAHIARVLYRDVLGVYEIAPTEKRISLRFSDCGLRQCKGSIPVGDDNLDVEWTLENGELNATVLIPEGYTVDYSLNGITRCNFTAF